MTMVRHVGLHVLVNNISTYALRLSVFVYVPCMFLIKVICCNDFSFRTAVWMSYADLSMKCFCTLLTLSLACYLQDQDTRLCLVRKGKKHCFIALFLPHVMSIKKLTESFRKFHHQKVTFFSSNWSFTKPFFEVIRNIWIFCRKVHATVRFLKPR